MVDWKALNMRGLFPGPKETEAAFLKRVASLETTGVINEKKVVMLLFQQFGFFPDWATVRYSNRGLTPWEAAAIWITKTTARIQLKRSLKDGSFFGLYKRDEVLAHELVHLARIAFDENKYEEMFAFSTSENRFRRFFGAIFRRPVEATLFVIYSALPLAALFIDSPAIGAFLWSLPFLYVSFLLLRLLFAQKNLKKCLGNLAKVVENPLAFALRLTDEEIDLFARCTPAEINAFIKKQHSFRWNFLKVVLSEANGS